MTLAVDFLAAAAPQFSIALVLRDDGSATFDVPVTSPSGRSQLFRIHAVGKVSPTVREVAGVLPSFCPGRHINRDATFCLGWGDDAAPDVVNADSAEAWWGRVLAFLRLQVRASRARKWTGPEWAHGAAAIHQHATERAAEKLGAEVLDDLRQRRIQVEWANRRAPVGDRLLKVKRNGSDWYSVWHSARRVVNKQQPCVCAAGSIRHHRRLRNCADHAQQAYELANSLLLWGDEEDRFWTLFKGAQCCGTLEDCPLRALSSTT